MEGRKDIRDVIARTYARATELGACTAFTGRESTREEIFSLFKSRRAMEFCLEHDFPDMDLMREYKALGAADCGIYIDAGRIALVNPGTVVLVGDTRAEVACDRLDMTGRKPNRVYLLHGASAAIDASNWAMVFVGAARGCLVTGNAADHARIMGLKGVDIINAEPPYKTETE